MIRVTRRYQFSASHRLHSAQLSESDNQAIYGKCNNPFGHGHNYTLEVSVRGPVDPVSGLAVDLGALDEVVRSKILQAFDHRYLNEEVAEFRQLVPTTENLALVIEQRLKEGWPARLPAIEKIRIAETDRNIFEVNGNPLGNKSR